MIHSKLLMSTDHLPQQKRMRPGVKALIVHDNKILLISEKVKRNGKSVIISDFPGGGIEFGENLQDALKREVLEEVGLKIQVEKVVGAWDFVLGSGDHDDPQKDGVHIVCIGYQCSLRSNAKIDISKNPSEENIFDAKWYTKEELLADNGKLLKHPQMIVAVKNLDL